MYGLLEEDNHLVEIQLFKNLKSDGTKSKYWENRL